MRQQLASKNPTAIARIISAAENFPEIGNLLWRLFIK
jgi:hypothetical protein